MPAYLLLALQMAPLIVQTGGDIYAFVQNVIANHNKDGGPTDADFAALHAHEADLRAILNDKSRDTRA